MAETALPFELEPEANKVPVPATKRQGEAHLKDCAPGKIIDVDPALCDVSSFNGRSAASADPMANKAFVEDIRARGQQVAAIVRPSEIPGRFEVVAGIRRLGAVRYLKTLDPTVTFKVEVRQLNDKEAWGVGQSENAHRKDITELERAKNWHHAKETLFGGSQSELAKHLGVDKSVVSRMIGLATLPPVITDLVSNPANLRAHFAEKLIPALNDEQRKEGMLGHAKNMRDNGVKLAPAELIRRLTMTEAEAEAFRAVSIKAGRQERQAIWQNKPNGSSQLIIKAMPPELSREERKGLLKDLSERLRLHIVGGE